MEERKWEVSVYNNRVCVGLGYYKIYVWKYKFGLFYGEFLSSKYKSLGFLMEVIEVGWLFFK